MTVLGVIAASTGIAGALDIGATGLVMRAQCVPFPRLLRFVASGALGPSAMGGGGWSAGVGLALHFLIAGVWATLYAIAGDAWPRSAVP